jgi:hypothetical protein
LSDIEKAILEGDESWREEGGPLKSIYNSIANQNKVYTPLVIEWEKNRTKKVIDRAVFQRDLKKFYEKEIYSKESVLCVVIGKTTSPKIKLFKKEGEKFYIQTFEWKDTLFIEREGVPDIEVRGAPPKISTIKEEPWSSDYKALANAIDREKEGYTCMLMNALEGTNMTLQTAVLTGTFLDCLRKDEGNRTDRNKGGDFSWN